MSKAYDPTEDMNAEEKVRWFIDRVKWGLDRDERGLISLRSYEEAQKTLTGLLSAMQQDDKFHLDAVQAVQSLRAYLKSYRIQEGISKKVVDGDGDGWVYDGTPRKRPATPAEMEAGRKLRARKGGPAAKKGAKKAPAKKSPYQQRVDKFVRAVNQAKKGGAADKKRVRDLIRQDLVLKPKERHELTAMLDGRAPAPAKKAPAKAPAKRAAAKVPAKKPLPKPPAGVKDGGYDKDGFKLPDSDGVVRLSRPGDKARVGSPKKATPAPPAKKAPAAKKPAPKAPSAGEDPKARRDAVVAGLKNVIAQANQKELDDARRKVEQAFDKKQMAAPTAAALLHAINQRQKAIHARPEGPNTRIQRMKAKIGLGTTSHGKKTQAWQRLWKRDLGKARNRQDLIALQAQVNSLHKQGRISTNERQAMLNELKEKARAIGVAARTPQPPKSVRRPTPVGNGHETKAYEAIGAAKDDAALDRAVNSAAAAFNRGDINRERYNGVLAEAMRARERLHNAAVAGQKKPTVQPKMPPGAARARAKGNIPDSWKQRLNAIKDVSDIDRLMDELENDKTISDADYNEVARHLNEMADEWDHMEELDDYFDKGGDPFAAPAGPADIFEVIKGNDRFNVESFSKNGNVSDSYKITDKKTGKVFFAKDRGGGKDGAGKEAMAAAVGNALGWMDHRAVLAKPENGDGGDYVLIEGAFDPAKGRLHSLGAMRGKSVDDVGRQIARGSDPNSLMRMMLFDYLIANDEDRHYMNMHVVEDKNGGMRAVLIDHGRAFGGMRSDYRAIAQRANFSEWFERYLRYSARGWDARRMMRSAYSDDTALSKALTEITQKMDQRKIDAMVKQAVEQSGLEGQNADDYANLVRTRLLHIADKKNHAGIIKAFRN